MHQKLHKSTRIVTVINAIRFRRRISRRFPIKALSNLRITDAQNREMMKPAGYHFALRSRNCPYYSGRRQMIIIPILRAVDYRTGSVKS